MTLCEILALVTKDGGYLVLKAIEVELSATGSSLNSSLALRRGSNGFAGSLLAEPPLELDEGMIRQRSWRCRMPMSCGVWWSHDPSGAVRLPVAPFLGPVERFDAIPCGLEFERGVTLEVAVLEIVAGSSRVSLSLVPLRLSAFEGDYEAGVFPLPKRACSSSGDMVFVGMRGSIARPSAPIPLKTFVAWIFDDNCMPFGSWFSPLCFRS